jgi:hypothetical protein
MVFGGDMKYCKNQFTTNQAIRLSEMGIYKMWTPFQILAIQVYQKRLITPLSVFRKMVELELGEKFVNLSMADIQTEFERKHGEEFIDHGHDFVSSEVCSQLYEESSKKSLPLQLSFS